MCRGGGISPKFKNSEDGTLVSSTYHHHPPSLIKVQGQCPTPFPHPSYDLPVEYIQHSVLCTGLVDWYMRIGLVYLTGLAIQHTSPVHTTHQSCTYHGWISS